MMPPLGTGSAKEVGRGGLRATESEIPTSQWLVMKDRSRGQKPEYKRRMQIYLSKTMVKNDTGTLCSLFTIAKI